MGYVFENALKDALDVLHIHCFMTEVFYWLCKNSNISAVIEKWEVQFRQTIAVFFIVIFSNNYLDGILKPVKSLRTGVIQNAN